LEELSRFGDLWERYGFYLGGGTALALQVIHRESVDLDFFSQKEFDPAGLMKSLEDFGFSLSESEKSKGTLKFVLESCNVSFFHYPYENIETHKKFEVDKGMYVYLASIIDIGLMKITAIADRGVKKDFVDLYFIIKEIGDLQKIVDKFIKKFPTDNIYHYIKALSDYSIADKDPDLSMYETVDWIEVKRFIKSEVGKLQYVY